MELVAALPSELLAGAGPPPGGPAPLQRSADQDAAAATLGVPFELLLGLLQAPLPAGEALPAGGNALPAAAVPTDAAAATQVSASAGGSTPPPAASGGDLLARLRLAIGADPAAPPPGPPADSAPAPGAPVSFTVGDGAPPQAATLPATPAPPSAAPVAAEPPKAPGQEVAAAIEALLPRAGDGNRPPPRTHLPATDQNPGAESPTAATLASQGTAGATAAAGATPAVGEVVGNNTRSAQHETSFESLLAAPATAGDSAAPAPEGTSVVAPAHVATAHSPASSAPAPPASGAPVDTRAEHWHEAFAGRVQWLVDQHVGEARIKLNPPELGAVDVKISLVEDKTFVHLTAATSSARDELAQSLPRLRELLSSSGLSLGGATVQGGQTGHGGSSAPRGGPAAMFPSYGGAGGDDPVLVPVLSRPRGQIDLFA